MLRSAPSDGMKVAISLCAIISSTLTLSGYFGAFDFAARALAKSHTHAGATFDTKSLSSGMLFPPGLSELMGGPVASS